MVLVKCTEDTFEFKNSWGDWGYKGFFAMSRKLEKVMNMKFIDVSFTI